MNPVRTIARAVQFKTLRVPEHVRINTPYFCRFIYTRALGTYFRRQHPQAVTSENKAELTREHEKEALVALRERL